MEVPEHQRIYGEHMLHDSEMRLQYQHEYALAGLKTLVLINGGAIIALLTYIGNTNRRTSEAVMSAFGGYAAGIILAVLAYLFAYTSQQHFMNSSTAHGYRALGHEADMDTDKEEKDGGIRSAAAMVLAVLSLIGFIAGSLAALLSLR